MKIALALILGWFIGIHLWDYIFNCLRQREKRGKK